MASKVAIDIEARDRATKPLKDVQDAYERFKKRGMSGVTIGASAAVTAKAFSVVGAAIGTATDFMADSVRAAMEEQAGIAKLNASLAANVKGWEGQTAAIEKGIKAGERLAFSDDDVRDSLAKLVPVTHDVSKALNLQRTAMDLARLKGISLADASQALIDIEGGRYRALAKLIGSTKEITSETEALAAVEKAAAGQAAAYTETLAGKAEMLQIRMDNLQETVGGALIPVLDDAATALLGFGDAMDATGKTTDEQQAALTGFLSAVAGLTPFAKQAEDALADVNAEIDANQEAINDTAAAWDTTSESLAGLREPAATAANKTAALAEASRRAAANQKTLADRAKAAADRLRDIVKAADDARDALFGASKGPKETELSLEKAQLKGKDLKDELAKLEDKRPTRKVREDILDTKLAIIDNQEEVITLQGDLVRLNKVSLGKHEDTIRRLGFGWGDAKDELDAYLRLLSQVPGVKIPAPKSIGAGGGDRAQPRASGGPVSAHSLYRIGEKGEEWFVPDRDGTIIPNSTVRAIQAGSVASPVAAGAVAGVSLTINVSTPVMTPGAAQALADAIAPSITRWQQARGL